MNSEADSHSGKHRSRMTTSPIRVAKASLSQRLSTSPKWRCYRTTGEQLVRLDTGSALLSLKTGLLLVVEVDRGTSSDETPVLHGASIEVGGDKGVELGQRVKLRRKRARIRENLDLNVKSVLAW